MIFHAFVSYRVGARVRKMVVIRSKSEKTARKMMCDWGERHAPKGVMLIMYSGPYPISREST